MSRALTQQELEEYNKRRQKSLEETAKKFGLTPEQLEAAEQRARKELNKHARRQQRGGSGSIKGSPRQDWQQLFGKPQD